MAKKKTKKKTAKREVVVNDDEEVTSQVDWLAEEDDGPTYEPGCEVCECVDGEHDEPTHHRYEFELARELRLTLSETLTELKRIEKLQPGWSVSE